MEKYIKLLLICTTVMLSVNISVITISFIMKGTVILAAWMTSIGFTTILAFVAYYAASMLHFQYKRLSDAIKKRGNPHKNITVEDIIDTLK